MAMAIMLCDSNTKSDIEIIEKVQKEPKANDIFKTSILYRKIKTASASYIEVCVYAMI